MSTKLVEFGGDSEGETVGSEITKSIVGGFVVGRFVGDALGELVGARTVAKVVGGGVEREAVGKGMGEGMGSGVRNGTRSGIGCRWGSVLIVDIDRNDGGILSVVICRNEYIESLLCIERGSIRTGDLSVGIGPGIIHRVGIGVVVDHDIHRPFHCFLICRGDPCECHQPQRVRNRKSMSRLVPNPVI